MGLQFTTMLKRIMVYLCQASWWITWRMVKVMEMWDGKSNLCSVIGDAEVKVLHHMNLCMFDMIKSHMLMHTLTNFTPLKVQAIVLHFTDFTPVHFLLSWPLAAPRTPCLPSSDWSALSVNLAKMLFVCCHPLPPNITLASKTNGLYPLFNDTVISLHWLQAIMECHKASQSPSGL